MNATNNDPCDLVVIGGGAAGLMCAMTAGARGLRALVLEGANKVGKIANANGLKTEEYGVFVLDKSRYSSKEVTSFRYNEKGKEKIREILKEQ